MTNTLREMAADYLKSVPDSQTLPEAEHKLAAAQVAALLHIGDAVDRLASAVREHSNTTRKAASDIAYQMRAAR